MKTIHINWYGPFTLEDVNTELFNAEAPKDGLSGNGLYAWTGKTKGQRKDACLQYIGITTEAYK